MGWWGGKEAEVGRDICIHIADSLRCTAETNKMEEVELYLEI